MADNVGDVLEVLAEVELPSKSKYRVLRVKTAGGSAVQIVFDTGRSVRPLTVFASAVRPVGQALLDAADGARAVGEGTIRTHGFRVRVSPEGWLTIHAEDEVRGGRLSLPVWKLADLLDALTAARREFVR
jgi:hypothetical protein